MENILHPTTATKQLLSSPLFSSPLLSSPLLLRGEDED